MALVTKKTKKTDYVRSGRGGGESTQQTTGVESNGKFFPTANPDFKPTDPVTTTQIKFNQNGSVDYTPKGSMETFNLSKQEYNALQGKAGFVTDKTKQVQAQELNPLQAQQEALSQQQAEELQKLGQQDFTQLGQEQPQTQKVLPLNSMSSQLENALPLEARQQQFTADTAVAGGALAGGALAAGLAGGAAIEAGVAMPALNFGRTVTKARSAISSLRNIKVLGAIGTVYGILTNSKVKDIEGDINDLTSLSRTMASQVSSGADPVEVRQQLLDMENTIKDKIAEMNVAKRYSIKDRLIGSDSQEYARNKLTLIVLRRQAVERYMMSNDLNSFNSFMGSQGE